MNCTVVSISADEGDPCEADGGDLCETEDGKLTERGSLVRRFTSPTEGSLVRRFTSLKVH